MNYDDDVCKRETKRQTGREQGGMEGRMQCIYCVAMTEQKCAFTAGSHIGSGHIVRETIFVRIFHKRSKHPAPTPLYSGHFYWHLRGTLCGPFCSWFASLYFLLALFIYSAFFFAPFSSRNYNFIWCFAAPADTINAICFFRVKPMMQIENAESERKKRCVRPPSKWMRCNLMVIPEWIYWT